MTSKDCSPIIHDFAWSDVFNFAVNIVIFHLKVFILKEEKNIMLQEELLPLLKRNLKLQKGS